jgi:hypothetical protein
MEEIVCAAHVEQCLFALRIDNPVFIYAALFIFFVSGQEGSPVSLVGGREVLVWLA